MVNGRALGAHASAMYRLACRLLGGTQDAEDVLQDVYERAWIALRDGQFRGDAELSTWLYRITVNAALNRLRARRAAAALPASDEAVEPPRGEAAVALRELGAALALLPEDQRAALVLKELQGLSAREVAAVLERSEGAVEQLLVRARATLRERLQP